MITLVMPAVSLPDAITTTAYGNLVVPGAQLAAREVNVDETLVSRLLVAAKAAAQAAYAPFSNFHVGAAVIMHDDREGRIFTVANVENGSYGGTICAERTAVTAAVTAGCRRIRYLAVSVADALAAPLSDRSPCGLCRQVISQFCDSASTEPSLIFVQDGSGQALAQVFDIDRLLPCGFCFAPRDSAGP